MALVSPGIASFTRVANARELLRQIHALKTLGVVVEEASVPPPPDPNLAPAKPARKSLNR